MKLDFSILEAENNDGYGTWPLPCQRDSEIEDLVLALIATETQVQYDYAAVVIAFAERMASLARTERSMSRLRGGISAIALVGDIGDAREAVSACALLWQSAAVLGSDSAHEFHLAAELAGGSDMLVRFVERNPQDQTIEAMGYEESEDEDGSRYRRTW